MSTRASKRPLISYARDPQRKRVALKVNLNEVPPCENRPLETNSTRGNLRAPQASGQGVLPPSISGRLPNAPIIVEELAEEVDDEVTISSPRSFAEARNNLSRRRNHHQNLNQMVTVLVEDDNDVHQGLSGATEEEPDTRLTLNGYGNRGRAVSNHPPVVNLEKDVVTIPEPSPKPKQIVVAKEPVFSCAICISPLVEEHSTICGHIFCKKCIKEAIAAQKKCPTCRRHLRVNNIHRVYLPTTS